MEGGTRSWPSPVPPRLTVNPASSYLLPVRMGWTGSAMPPVRTQITPHAPEEWRWIFVCGAIWKETIPTPTSPPSDLIHTGQPAPTWPTWLGFALRDAPLTARSGGIKYLGSKRTLIGPIVAATGAPTGAVADLFSGTSRVGHAFKSAGYYVKANDKRRTHRLARCYVAADAERVLQPRIPAELRTIAPQPGYFTDTLRQITLLPPQERARGRHS